MQYLGRGGQERFDLGPQVLEQALCSVMRLLMIVYEMKATGMGHAVFLAPRSECQIQRSTSMRGAPWASTALQPRKADAKSGIPWRVAVTADRSLLL
ncbi:hypothetical protein BRAS3809_5270010 [Bradyrhizobium sp. STM 3809]|nr:hypothetical protein BRAS3809_5270010 [Bradyrhizobium sp. STM 3809]